MNEVRPVRVGVQIAQHSASFDDLRRAAISAEEIGADMLFTWDHFFPPGQDADGDHFECWMTLASWAAATSRLLLGPLVSAIGYRNPDLLADMARTLDHASNGRVILGLGAGFKERDYTEYQMPYGPPGARVEELAQGAARIRRRLSLLNPSPKGPLPLLIGGGGERKTLRVVAEHADIWHTFAEGDEFARKSAALDRFCLQLGRDSTQIERSVLVGGDPSVVGPPLLALGATTFIVMTSGQTLDLAPLRQWVRWRDTLQ